MDPSLKLLRDYLERGDESAFRTLVHANIKLVYSAALRQTNGDTAMAADVAQIVFTDLARLGPAIKSNVLIGGWFHKHTYFVASKLMRSERRRKAREQMAFTMNLVGEPEIAWNQISPLLDDSVRELLAADRAIIILRYLEQKSLRAVGEALGISDDSAQKRVSRAVERLRQILSRKGVKVSTASLTAVLVNSALDAAPATLAGTISSVVISTAVAAPTGILFGNLILTSKTAFVALIILASTVVIALNYPKASAGTGGSDALSVAAARTKLNRRLRRQLESVTSVREKTSIRVDVISSAERAIAALRSGLASKDAEGQSQALHLFFEAFDSASDADKPDFREAIPVLIEAMPHIQPVVLQSILSLFDTLRPATEAVINIYVAYLAQHPNEAAFVAGYLSQAGPLATKATGALVTVLKIIRSQNPPVTENAAQSCLYALASFGPAAWDAAPSLREYLSDTNTVFSMYGAYAYWRITGDVDSVLPTLTNAWLTGGGNIKAAEMLESIGVGAAPSIPALQAVYDSTITVAETRMRAYEAIRKIDPSFPANPSAVIEYLSVPPGKEWTRMKAVQILWNQFHDLDQVLPAVTQSAAYESEHDLGIHATGLGEAFDLIAETGPRAAKLLPALQQVLESKFSDPGNRTSASNAWLRIAPTTPVPSI